MSKEEEEQKEPYGYIYRATNKLNDKDYVGLTKISRWDTDID